MDDDTGLPPDDWQDDLPGLAGPPSPIVWSQLTSQQAEATWLDLNEWVERLRHDYSIPATVIPPFWHRHQLLIEQLTALWTHWLAAFDAQQHSSAPFGWTRDLDEWANRMREAVARLGCRVDSCRPEIITRWPGEPDPDPASFPPPVNLADRYDDLVTIVLWDVRRRHLAEQQAIADAAAQADEKLGLPG